MRFLAIVLMAALIVMAVPTMARPVETTIAFGGLERSYVVHAPSSVAGRNAPLVIVLHGQGGDGANALQQGYWVEKADADGFIVVAPEGMPERPDRPARLLGNRRSWNSGPATGSPAAEQGIDDVGFIRAVIADVRRTYAVDGRRIFATGFSNGAAMAFRVGAEMSDVVAAIAPVSNALLMPVERLARPVSLLMIWGVDDPLNPFAGGSVARGGQRLVRPTAEDSLARWASLLRCTGAPRIERPNRKLTQRTFDRCESGSVASLIAVDGLGHQWPGGRVYLRVVSGPGSNAVNATDAIWAFFASHGR